MANIVWQQNSDFAQMQQQFGCENTWELPVKIDLDNVEDVRLLAHSESRWRALATLLLQQLKSSTPRVEYIAVWTLP